MGLRPFTCSAALLALLLFCVEQKVEAKYSSQGVFENSHRVLSTGTKLRDPYDMSDMDLGTRTVSVVKPSYPTAVSTPAFPSDTTMTMPSAAAPAYRPSNFPSLAATGGGGGGGSGGGGSWCVASQSASPAALQVALDYACGYGGADCSAIQPGGSCFNPDTVHDHASYAFNSYYQKNPIPTSCDFGGTATLTTVDPSTSTCQLPSSSTGAPSQNMTTPMAPPITPSTPTTPTTGPPVYGISPPAYGSTSPPVYGSLSPPDYSDNIGAAAVLRGKAVLSLICLLVAAVTLNISE